LTGQIFEKHANRNGLLLDVRPSLVGDAIVHECVEKDIKKSIKASRDKRDTMSACPPILHTFDVTSVNCLDYSSEISKLGGTRLINKKIGNKNKIVNYSNMVYFYLSFNNWLSFR